MAGSQETTTPRKDTRRRRDLAAAAMLATGIAAVLAAAFAWSTLAGVAVAGVVLITGGVAAGME